MQMTSTRSSLVWAAAIAAYVFGCATYSQTNDALPGPAANNESGAATTAGNASTDGGSSSTPMTDGGISGGGASGGSGGSGTSGGTFSTAGKNAGGNGGVSGSAGASSGGGGGASGHGGASSGGSGGASSGGSGGASSGGSGGKGGAGGSGGVGGQSGGACASLKLVPLAASDGGNAESAPAFAIDGLADTRWDSVHMNDAAYLQIDMGETITVNRVSILWQNSYATDYKIQIADNAAGPFTDLYEDKAGNGGTDDIMAPNLKLGRGRYVRMQGVTRHTQNYGYSIYEMTVYGDPDEICK